MNRMAMTIGLPVAVSQLSWRQSKFHGVFTPLRMSCAAVKIRALFKNGNAKFNSKLSNCRKSRFFWQKAGNLLPLRGQAKEPISRQPYKL